MGFFYLGITMKHIVANIDVQDIKKKYQTRIWAGIRKLAPSLNEYIYPGSKTTFLEQIESGKRNYPALLVWEQENGETRYSEVTVV
jgi:hypothetical protein